MDNLGPLAGLVFQYGSMRGKEFTQIQMDHLCDKIKKSELSAEMQQTILSRINGITTKKVMGKTVKLLVREQFAKALSVDVDKIPEERLPALFAMQMMLRTADKAIDLVRRWINMNCPQTKALERATLILSPLQSQKLLEKMLNKPRYNWKSFTKDLGIVFGYKSISLVHATELIDKMINAPERNWRNALQYLKWYEENVIEDRGALAVMQYIAKYPSINWSYAIALTSAVADSCPWAQKSWLVIHFANYPNFAWRRGFELAARLPNLSGRYRLLEVIAKYPKKNWEFIIGKLEVLLPTYNIDWRDFALDTVLLHFPKKDWENILTASDPQLLKQQLTEAEEHFSVEGESMGASCPRE